MADANQGGAPDPNAPQGEEGEKKEEELTCGQACSRGCFTLFEGLRKCITAVISGTCLCLGTIWYPFKQGCSKCCRKCKLWFNPASDPAYTQL